ncbi:uncharacterized protein LOC121049153 [Rosa chinensis]|uniref:uncharacterized protein LOC121049153 n=1 Tax=Rosa chinensis TaxID=74649 RepID=UPI001AD8FC13|nr:uncharacterized protein LOC121049153 [Rosa chinensis]
MGFYSSLREGLGVLLSLSRVSFVGRRRRKRGFQSAKIRVPFVDSGLFGLLDLGVSRLLELFGIGRSYCGYIDSKLLAWVKGILLQQNIQAIVAIVLFTVQIFIAHQHFQELH